MTARASGSEFCAYCGLPVPKNWWPAQPADRGPEFCCFGCRIAAAITGSSGVEGEATATLTRLGLAVFCTMNLMVFTMALWTHDFYPTDVSGAGDAFAPLRGLFRYLSLLFALPVLFLLGGPLLQSAWENLQRGRWTSDLLLLLGVAASYCYSAVSVLRDDGPIYFEVGCMVLVLVTVGRWLEATGKRRTTEALDALQKLLPETAEVAREGPFVRLPIDAIRPGDHVRVLAGQRIPCDGRVLDCPATVDEQILTGESVAVSRQPGELVHSGTLNIDDVLTLEVTAPASEGTLARLVELVRTARASKGRFEQFADRVAAGFLPAVVLIALAAAIWHGLDRGPAAGILTGLAVVLIACPCALGLATPMAVWAALGEAARVQILFKNGEALERLAGIRAVRFDKTGTLTTGTPVVENFFASGTALAEDVFTRAATLAKFSTHAYSQAVARFVATLELRAAESPSSIHTLPGRGVWAEAPQGRCTALGSPAWMEEMAWSIPRMLGAALQEARDRGQPVTAIGWDGEVRGIFVFQEELRPHAKEIIDWLRGHRIDAAVVTGDRAAPAARLAQLLDVPILAGLLPEAKVAALAEARQRWGRVAMVGDGINDAPALASSDVGIALGCGADISRDSALVCLLRDDLRQLPEAIDLARRTVRIIQQNLGWAFSYNVLGIAFACTGRLNPVFAAAAMVVSSLLVLLNSLRLRRASLARPSAAAPPVQANLRPTEARLRMFAAERVAHD